jgi:hypothetical protein
MEQLELSCLFSRLATAPPRLNSMNFASLAIEYYHVSEK